MSDIKYWREAVDVALDEVGAFSLLTTEQREDMAKCLLNSAEMERECSGEYNIPNPMRAEIKELKSKLDVERQKVGCRACNGHGSVTYNYGTLSSTSRCDRCNGEGKHLP